MATECVRVKNGMGGSRCGRERTAGTEEYKASGKKRRRLADKKEVSSRMREV